MVQIVDVKKSDRKGKKLKAILSDGNVIHFGLEGSQTYTEGASKEKRDAYLKRHIGNKTEKSLIENKIVSPSLFAYYLLWNTPSLEKNISILNSFLKKN